MGTKSAAKRRGVQTAPRMAVKQEVIEIDDSSPSPVRNCTPMRPIFCLKNREEIKKFEEQEECFILDFNPYNNLDVLRLPGTESVDSADADLSVVGETGQVVFNSLDYFCLVFDY